VRRKTGEGRWRGGKEGEKKQEGKSRGVRRRKGREVERPARPTKYFGLNRP